jgi:hypothetical protein
MPKKPIQRFTADQRKQLTIEGLQASHIEALERHALAQIQAVAGPAPETSVKLVLEELLGLSIDLGDACGRILYHCSPVRTRSGPRSMVRAPGRPEVLMAPNIEELKLSLTVLKDAWLDFDPTEGDGCSVATEGTDRDRHTSPLPFSIGDARQQARTMRSDDGASQMPDPGITVQSLWSGCRDLEAVARTAISTLPKGQRRREEGNPAPILSIWRAIDQEQRRVLVLNRRAESPGRPLLPMSSLKAPWIRGSRFEDVVRVCYEACGVSKTPKTALRIAKATMKKWQGADPPQMPQGESY